MKGLLALFICLPLCAVAEPVVIRTGEHATFTRFVMSIGDGTGWTVDPVENGVLVNLTGRDEGFDTSEVFTRIPKDRVSDVSQPAGNRLLLNTACACSIDAFEWKPGELVLDVIDGAPVADTTPLAADRALAPPSQTAPLRLPDLLTLRQSNRFATEFVAATPAPEPDTSTNMAALETALLEGLARAASQGFLEANINEPPSLERDVSTAVDTPIKVAPAPTSSPHPGVGITTALDREMAVIRDITGLEADSQCLPESLFQIDTWGDDRAFHTQVADLAEALSGEFGEQPREAQDKLARLYLHFGFGAEARAVLAADPARSQDRTVLMQLAGLIDGYDEPYQLLATQSGCDTAGALWAFFAAPISLEEEAKNHILQVFFTLPQPLRGQIAPSLARRFTETGMLDAAERLLRATENTDAGLTHDTAATRAMIAQTDGRPQDAISVLTSEVDDNSRTSPASLIRLIDLAIENGQPVEESNLILAAAMRQEHRDRPVAGRLAVAEAAGYNSLGQYEAAFDLLRNRDEPAALNVLNQTVLELTRHADAPEFLSFAFDTLPNGTRGDTENAVAARLIDLGFPERATEVLAGSAQREAAAERRYLRAMASIGTADYAAAIEGLLGLTTLRANDLRAQAHVGLGEHRAVLSAIPPDERSSVDGILEFRAGAWERLTVDEDAVLSSFARSVLRPPTPAPTTLSERRDILAQSQDSRRAIQDLLSRFDGAAEQE